MIEIIATNESKPRELIPQGNYIGRCVNMVYIGTIDGKFGKTKKVRLTWELPTQLKEYKEGEGEKPAFISKEYNLSLNPKSNLYMDLVSWRGMAFTEDESKAFNIVNVLGAPCMVNVIHTASKSDASKMYEDISSITPIPQGLSVPDQISPSVAFSVDKFDQKVFDDLPEFVQNKIKESQEYKAMKDETPQSQGNDAGSTESEEDLPF